MLFHVVDVAPPFASCSGASSWSWQRGADKLALLSFKSVLSAGASGGLLASWNSTPGLYCTWPGVFCGSRHPERVVALRLGSSGLSGRISLSLGNLSFLKELDLSGNQLVGEIPPELGPLSKLRFLNLNVNSLQGTIPATIGGCTKLEMLGLGYNQLPGEIPLSTGANMRNLAYLVLERNSLSGEIPPALGNLTNLSHLSLAENHLSGAIPSSLGRLSREKLMIHLGREEVTNIWGRETMDEEVKELGSHGGGEEGGARQFSAEGRPTMVL